MNWERNKKEKILALSEGEEEGDGDESESLGDPQILLFLCI